MKGRICHPVVCCGTYWTPLNTVLMQGKKPKRFKWFDCNSSRKINSDLCWSLPGAKHPSSLGCPCEGPSSRSHHLNPVVPVDAGRHCSLANVYFMWRGKKRKREHCEFEDQSHYVRVSYILSQGPAIWVLIAVTCFEMHRGGLMFMWNSFDKSRQTRVRKVNETKPPSIKLRSLLTQQLWGNNSNLDGHLTRAPSNFHRCN